MTSIIPVGGRADAAGDGGLQILAPGISLPFADGRYVKRFVGAVLAADTYLGENSGGTEVVLANPNGPVMGGIPLDADPLALGSSLYHGRFSTRAGVFAAALTPQFDGVRVQGTLAVPSVVLDGNFVVSYRGLGWSGSALSLGAEIAFAARGDWSGSNQSASINLRTVDTAGTTTRTRFIVYGESGVSNFLSQQALFRFIPASGGSYTWRRPANDADTMVLSGDGTSFTLPLVTAVVLGTDPGGTALLRVGGGIRSNATFQTTAALAFASAITTGVSEFAGGNASGSGSNIRLFGSAHATQANDIEFRAAAGVRGFYDSSAALWDFSNATSLLVRFASPAAGETALYVYDADNATLERVTVGAADSGGAGFKVLRIPN